MISDHVIDNLADVVDYVVGHAEGTPAERAEEIRDALIEKGVDTKFEEFLSWFSPPPSADILTVIRLLRSMVEKWPAGQSRNTCLTKLGRITTLAKKGGAS